MLRGMDDMRNCEDQELDKVVNVIMVFMVVSWFFFGYISKIKKT